LRAFDARSAAQEAGISEDDIRALAHRFMSERPSLALAPGAGAYHRNATAASLATLILNSVAGNVGRTLHLDGGPTRAARPYADMEEAVRSMAAGNVAVAMVHGVNPVYSLPAGSGFEGAFSSVAFKVSFASAPDETSALADLVMPDRHFLESWGDSEPKPGIYAIRQPIMEPVPHFDAKQTADVLIAVGSSLGADFGGAATFYEYLHAANREMYKGPDFDHHWHEMLRNGLWKRDVAAPAAPSELRAPDKALIFDVPTLDGDGDFALLVHPAARFGAGEHTNIPWLLEMPDPVSKITWHSWLEIHPDAAAAQGLHEGDFVTVTSPYGSLDVPVWPYPGIRPDAVALAMGMGHTDFGRWATGKGVNAMELLPAVAEQPSGAFVTVATKVSVTPTGSSRRLAKTQSSDSQADRPITPAVTLAALGHGATPEGSNEIVKELQGTGGFVPVRVPNSPTSHPLPGAQHGPYANPEELPRWGMAIDLDKCTGCGACEVACMAENNVPWVGEDQVMMGREMHWLRIERYYEKVNATSPGALDVRVIPMMCQQCSNAPCEPVCPTFATYSTPEGVSAQVYNRCVGTRYCSNNCPYKVRTFNWLRYTEPQRIPEPYNWQWNPDVTVRDNGVMEKCTFCVQRVREAENRAVVENRGPYPRDGEVLMACQQSCPAEAIVWGNLRDPSTRVSQIAANERTYRALNEELNTQPGVNYLKKVTFHQLSSEESS
jgi:molybdopterin-containing oxidoreductase family iron-sulfur binding subunit